MARKDAPGAAAARRKAREFFEHCAFWKLDPGDFLPARPEPRGASFDYAAWLGRCGLAHEEAAAVLGITAEASRRYGSGGAVPAELAAACAAAEAALSA